jgi:hypothetical protein
VKEGKGIYEIGSELLYTNIGGIEIEEGVTVAVAHGSITVNLNQLGVATVLVICVPE